MKHKRTAISPTRQENFQEWYQQVIKHAELADHSSVRGCMVIRPWGYALWEKMRDFLDHAFQQDGCQNAYFPLFIPLSSLQKEAQHVDGFAKECAVVTHHRLEQRDSGELIPAGKLEEPLVVRPTSEMIIGESFSKWIQSHRDLPLKINQWANVVRWEMRTRMFLRTSEFLWQEGHTAHATADQALEQAKQIHELYVHFAREVLALPVVSGEKTSVERFAGAERTFTLEAMMQDGKALQCGTSHYLGQSFSKAMNIQFQDDDLKEKFVWTTSWGLTTRLIGAMIMVHGDDDGLVIPPRVAPNHIVILPIRRKNQDPEPVLKYCHELKAQLEDQSFVGESIRVILDERDLAGGEKSWGWVKKGIPLRIEVGQREVEENSLSCSRRDQAYSNKQKYKKNEFLESVDGILTNIQNQLLDQAKLRQQQRIHEINDSKSFEAFCQSPLKQQLGWALVDWGGDDEKEVELAERFGITIRCVLAELPQKKQCVYTAEPAVQRVIFARSY